MTNETRQRMNNLSKLVFGTSSKWQKLVNGIVEPMEREREVTVPDGRGGVKTKVFTDKKSVLKRYTVNEVAALMLDLLKYRMEAAKNPDVLKLDSAEDLLKGWNGDRG